MKVKVTVPVYLYAPTEKGEPDYLAGARDRLKTGAIVDVDLDQETTGVLLLKDRGMCARLRKSLTEPVSE